jgi:ribosomal protein S18 acetylase RimI-like enzyme
MLDREMPIWEFGAPQDRQRCGHGRALLETALASARARDLEAITPTNFRDVSWNELL